MKEIWKRLIYQSIDYGDFYEISNLGNIRNSRNKRIRKQHVLKTGYFFASGSLGSRENKITFKIHRAVAETFIPNPENKPQVNHIDGNKLNNCVSNLEWCTNRENIIHAYKIGLNKGVKGCDNHNSKLTKEQVDFIRSNFIPRDKNLGMRGLGRKFGVHHKTIHQIINNKCYIDN